MNRIVLLKITNLLLFISAAVQVLTGIVLFFNLLASQAKIFEMIAQTHRYNGLVFFALVAAHLSLNWSWVKNQFFYRRPAG